MLGHRLQRWISHRQRGVATQIPHGSGRHLVLCEERSIDQRVVVKVDLAVAVEVAVGEAGELVDKAIVDA